MPVEDARFTQVEDRLKFGLWISGFRTGHLPFQDALKFARFVHSRRRQQFGGLFPKMLGLQAKPLCKGSLDHLTRAIHLFICLEIFLNAACDTVNVAYANLKGEWICSHTAAELTLLGKPMVNL